MRTPLLRIHLALSGVIQRIRNEHGASLVEYALLASFIAFACLAAITYLGGETGNSLDSSQQSITTAN
jgi:Flp pilus assembly pilin Flp